MNAGGGAVVDRWIRRSDRGRLLTGGAPARMIRLSAAGAMALDGLLAGSASGPDAARLGERLLSAGLIHPVATMPTTQPLTLIVPVRDGGPGLAELAAELLRLGEVIVVDDGSRDGSAVLAAEAGARVEANRGVPGPAGARNTGLALARTELVAFVDADCHSSSGWATRLASLLEADPGLALAAPRVRGLPGKGAIAHYETGASPLDMGPDPSLVGPGRRVGFVPSAALVARRSALLEVGGFDERRRVGEDVDLVLRLLARGWRIRYAPEVEVEHRSREDLAGLVRQRFAYARSAAQIDRSHPGAVAPLRGTPQAVAVWLAAAAAPRAGLAAVGGAVLAATTKGSDAATKRALALLTVDSLVVGSRHLARALARDWLPLTLLAALSSRRGRRLAALAIAIDVAGARGSDAQPQCLLERTLLRQVDNVSYASGLWLGAIRLRSAGAILPRLVKRGHGGE